MIIQTFAENAIKHGLVKRKEEGILLIEINSDESYINISVNDNGIGRSEAQRIETNSTGMGQVIIKEFISLLNRFNENKIYLQISDKLDENKKVAGTLVTIKLPNNISFNSIPKTQ
jgi:sensor histidine kinase YesM